MLRGEKVYLAISVKGYKGAGTYSASQEESGEAQARDEGGGPDEAHGSDGHPCHHAADQADELRERFPEPRLTRIRGATLPVAAHADQKHGRVAPRRRVDAPNPRHDR